MKAIIIDFGLFSCFSNNSPNVSYIDEIGKKERKLIFQSKMGELSPELWR